MNNLYNFSDHEFGNVLDVFNARSNYEHAKDNQVIYFEVLKEKPIKVTQNILINYFNNKETAYRTELFFNKFKGYKISDKQLYYDTNKQSISLESLKDLIVVEDELPHHKAGLSYTTTGYGPKIPTIYKVWKNKRFYRVYVMQYSNAGTAYIIERGEKLILS